MEMETKAAGVIVKVVEPDTGSELAVIVVLPGAKLLASPFVPALLLMVANDASDELQCTAAVRS